MSEQANKVSSTNLNNNNYSKFVHPKNVKQTADHVLIFDMTKEEAQAEGLTNIFNTYDADSNGKIDQNEWDKYNVDVLQKKQNHSTASVKKYNMQTDTEIANSSKKIVENNNGYSDSDIKKSNINLNSYTKEKYNLDLSGSGSVDDKAKSFAEKFNTEFDVSNADSKVLESIKERLLAGNYTHIESNKLGLKGKKLTDEQAEFYAKQAIQRKESYEFHKLLTNVKDPNQRAILLHSIKYADNNVQSNFTAIAVSGEKNKSLKKELAAEMANSKIDFTGTENKLVNNTTETVARNTNAANGRKMLTNFKMGGTQQYTAFRQIDAADIEKVKTGEITKQQYNADYKALAGDAYKLKLASYGYKYMQANTNNENRAEVMKTLGSNVYQIADENQRNQSLQDLKSSKYYTPDVEKAVNNSYKNYINSTKDAASETNEHTSVSQTTEKSINNQPSAPNHVSEDNKNITTKEEKVTNKSVTNPLKNSDEQVSKLINTSIKAAGENGITQKEKQIRGKKVSDILNYCFRNGNPPQKIEQIIYNKLAAASLPVIINVFTSCDTKVQKFIFDKHLLPLGALVSHLRKEDVKRLPEEIKSAIVTSQYTHTNINFADGSKQSQIAKTLNVKQHQI